MNNLPFTVVVYKNGELEAVHAFKSAEGWCRWLGNFLINPSLKLIDLEVSDDLNSASADFVPSIENPIRETKQ